MNFLPNHQLVRVAAASAAGATDVASSIVDTAGYDGVMFFTTFGAITSGAVTSIKAQQNSVNSGTGMADLAGTGIPVADDDDGQTFAIEVHKPRERYVRCVVSRATQNAVVGEIYALLYGGPRKRPFENNVADTLTAEIHVSPVEGTA